MNKYCYKYQNAEAGSMTSSQKAYDPQAHLAENEEDEVVRQALESGRIFPSLRGSKIIPQGYISYPTSTHNIQGGLPLQTLTHQAMSSAFPETRTQKLTEIQPPGLVKSEFAADAGKDKLMTANMYDRSGFLSAIAPASRSVGFTLGDGEPGTQTGGLSEPPRIVDESAKTSIQTGSLQAPQAQTSIQTTTQMPQAQTTTKSWKELAMKLGGVAAIVGMLYVSIKVYKRGN